MFKKIFNILALTLASKSAFAVMSINQQCQMANNIIKNTNTVESCCFNERIVCDTDMKNVIQLNLSGLGLTKLDEDIFKLPLIALDLSDNKKLKKIPKKIKNLARLEILNLSDLPKLKKLPSSITTLKNLSILILNNDTNLKQLPVDIGDLTSLNQLYAISSGLEILPSSIVNLKNLIIANFSNSGSLYGKVPDLPKGVICDYSGTHICHYEDQEYPTKWSLPADNFCEKVSIPINIGIQDTNVKAMINNTNDDDDDDEDGDDEEVDYDYRCGEVDGKKFGVCPNNGCCSKFGWCGITDAHCKIDKGCQPKYGICYDKDGNEEGVVVAAVTTAAKTTTTVAPTTTIAPTTTTTQAPKATPDVPENYRCGKGYGVCGRGQCCSKFGWCGTSEDFCHPDTCQKDYGVCWNKGDSNTSSTPKYKSVPGRCGSLYGRCPVGFCCSKYGWCGVSQSYCAINKCQPDYGMCTDIVDRNNDSLVRDDGRCGEGYGTCAPGTCCSKYGWCGTEDIFCRINNGCQPNYGFCKE